MKGKVQLVVWVLSGLLMCPTSALAWRNGPLAERNGSTASGGASCMQCHGTAVGGGSVQILGAPASYAINTTYDLTVRISDAAQAGAGFQISVEDAVGTHVGTMSLDDTANTKFNDFDANWVNHNADGVTNAIANWGTLGNAAEYTVRWQAPSTDVGPVTFWAAGNAINNNGNSSGDFIYLTSETATFDISSIPTVSQWGLAVLALAVLAAGTVVVRRQTATAL